MHHSRRFRYLPLLLSFVATAAIAATPTPATNAREGVANARTHATVAAQVDTLDGVHLHLHHVINCLEGPHGKLYSAKAEALSAYHCNGLQSAAVNDPAAGPKVEKLARQAVQEAQAGIRATSLDAAHRDAASVVKTLAAAQQAWPEKS